MVSDTAATTGTPGAALAHRQVRRETALLSDGTWSGAMSCECGWAVRAEKHRSREALAIVLRRAWRFHAGATA
ncbi:MAG: hypothetical protein KGJ77_06740 [Acidobacteriota bacterium]|nr:hypothetical protein [Acidobacteriota bacterium]